MNFPIVYNKLMTAWSGLSLRYFLQSAYKFKRRFDRERQRVVCLSLPIGMSIVQPGDDEDDNYAHHATRQNRLKVPRSVAEDDEDDILLGSQTMNPSMNPYPLVSVRSGVPNLRLQCKRST